MRIRPALPTDAAAAAPLIALSMAGFGDAVLGLNDRQRQLRALEHFFRQPASRFSYDCGQIAEMNGHVVGILLAFPSAEMDARNSRMARQFSGAYNFLEILKIIWLSLPVVSLPEAFPGEFYTANLAVDPGWQGRGIGAALLDCAERLAMDAGLSLCALNVDHHNPRAKALYERQGYRVTRSFPTPKMLARYHTAGFDHMQKPLTPKETPHG